VELTTLKLRAGCKDHIEQALNLASVAHVVTASTMMGNVDKTDELGRARAHTEVLCAKKYLTLLSVAWPQKTVSTR
jgi:hypothetical protein